MGYYEDLQDAVHDQLKKVHKEQNKSIEKIFHELNVTSKETIRKMTNDDYRSWRPDLQTLEDLKEKLGIEVPDYRYRTNLPAEAMSDLHSIEGYFARFDGYQRGVTLSFCEFLDDIKKHYEKEAAYRSYRVPAVADQAVVYDAGRSQKENKEQSSASDLRKTD